MNHPSETDLGKLHPHLQIDTPLGHFLGRQRIGLLEAIHRHGSIARAARAVSLSYKAAWEAVDEMNQFSELPLVSRVSGGARGGGTTLTAWALRLVAFYRALEQEQEAALERMRAALDQSEVDDVPGFRRLLRRMSMQSSARNQFVGTVQAITAGPVECEVRMQVTPGLDIAAVVTTESVERMGLMVGSEAYALVKSSSVMLLSGGAQQISARNRLVGRVVRILRGAVNSEVTLQLAGGPVQIASVITDDSLQRLALRKGSEVTAFFKASSVLLAVAG